MNNPALDIFDKADDRLTRLFDQLETARNLIFNAEEGTFAMHDALNALENGLDEIYTYIGVARQTTRQALELSDYLLEQRREALINFRHASAQVKAMRRADEHNGQCK